MKSESANLMQVMQLDLHNNGKKYMMWTGIILGGIAAIVCLIGVSVFHKYDPQYWENIYYYSSDFEDPMADAMLLTFWFGIIICGCVCASTIFSQLSSKGGTISNLMLPTTQFNKYLTRWLICVPGFIITYIICFEIVDLGRCAVLMQMCESHDYIHPVGFNLLRDMPDVGRWALVSSALLGQSFYILGSAIWPKRSFLYTSLSLFILKLAVSIVTSIYFSILVKHDFFDYMNHGDLNDEALGWTLAGVALLGTLINYTVAYFRYKEIEIVPRW